MTTTLEKINGVPVAEQPDPRAVAEAEAIRMRAAAEAKAIELKAKEEAEKVRLANEKAAMRLEKDRVEHEAKLAAAAKKAAEDQAAAERARRQAEVEAEQAEDRDREQQRTENLWKWGARAIYAVGLVIAAPVQFLAFWDPERPFLVAAPALLEGLALVLAAGAAWAVAHRRDVAPYRVGIMLGACIAAGINLWHGFNDPDIGKNAGLIGAIASLGGPIVLMAYEHGIAQKADGIPSFRERRAAKKEAEREAAAKAAAKAERDAAAKKAAADKAAAEKRAAEEQARRDADRQDHHPEVWKVADKLRAARGAAAVTNEIWADAWFLVTGSKKVGIDAEIEAQSKAAQARMRAASETPVADELSQDDSQKAPRAKRDPDAPDGRRFNRGTPPRRTPGDTQPYTLGARRQASLEQTANTTTKEG